MAWNAANPANDCLLINAPALIRANWDALALGTDASLLITNAKVSASAAIVDTKLAQITTAAKVHGTSITGLASLPAGAGAVPDANSNGKLKADASDTTPQYLDSLLDTGVFQISAGDLLQLKDGGVETVKLVNGSASPGNSKYYGTDSGGVKGFFSLDYTKDAATDISAKSWVLDEDDLASNDNTKVATQQSIKYYIDNKALVASSVTQAILADYAAGDDVIMEATTDRTTVATSYTKLKEFRLSRSGTLRIKWYLGSGAQNTHGYGKVYRNGVAVGAEQDAFSSSTGGITWLSVSEDISGWSSGDLLQIYIYTSNASNAAHVKDVYICNSEYINDRVLTD